MKKSIMKIYIIVLSVAVTACLDDDKAALDPSGSENILEFADLSVPSSPAGAIYPAWTTAFPVSEEDEMIAIVSYSGPNSNNKDIEITLAVDPFALAAYNEQQAAGGYSTFSLLPEANYDIPNLVVTIPKGQTKVNVPITLYPDQFDLSQNFAIPLRIVSASSGIISSNYSVAILVTVVKNKYDGVYTVTGWDGLAETDAFRDVTNAVWEGIYPKTVTLRTVDGNSVYYYDEDYGIDGHIFYTGTGASYFGGFDVQFNFADDPDVNGDYLVTDVVNRYGQGNNNRSAFLDPGPEDIDRDGDGTIENNDENPTLDEEAVPAPVAKMTFEADGVTPKTMEIWYYMRQLNTSTNRAFFKETYTYVEPRE